MMEELHPGEVSLYETRVSLSRFALRYMFRAVLTGLVLGPVGFLVLSVSIWQVLLGLFGIAAVGLFYGLIYDEHLDWFRRRHDRWVLTNRRLLYLGEAIEPSALPLSDILWVRRWFWWSLRLGLADGRKMMIDFVAEPGDMAEALTEALERQSG